MAQRKNKILKEDGCQVNVVHLKRVERAWKESISNKDLERLSLTYKVLGNNTRLKMVMALQSGEMCVCDLAAFTGLSDSAVSHQLRRLKDLDLVKQRRGRADSLLFPERRPCGRVAQDRPRPRA